MEKDKGKYVEVEVEVEGGDWTPLGLLETTLSSLNQLDSVIHSFLKGMNES